MTSLLTASSVTAKWTPPCTWNPGKEFKVWVYTSDVEYAGTDSGIMFRFYENLEECGRVCGDIQGEFAHPDIDDFERGNIDTFKFEAPSNTLFSHWETKTFPRKVLVISDNEEPDAGWHLDKIVLENTCSGKQMEYSCDCWIGGADHHRSNYIMSSGTPSTRSSSDGKSFYNIEMEWSS